MGKQPYQNFRTDRDESGTFRVTLDVPGKPLNILDRGVMTELEHIVTDLESRNDIDLVVFQSGKESGFLAGADIEVINNIRFTEQAERLLLEGQDLFARIERLPQTTLAVLHGPCLGGGLEFALSCDFRIARDNSSTKIGLPEIKLGVIPGWGGTQRLPRKVGLRHALELILSGKHLSARDALRIGLIDLAIAPDDWGEQKTRAIDAIKRGRSITNRPAGLQSLSRQLDRLPPLRNLLLSLTRKRLAHRTEHYPAIESAILAVGDAFRKNVDGFETERREFARLVLTPTCQQLLRLFFCRERSRNLATWAPVSADVVHESPIRNLGVIGAGAMGAGIAQASLSRGYRVTVKEADAAAAERGLSGITKLIDQYSRHKGFDTAKRAEMLGRLDVTTSSNAFADADCVIEAVVEVMAVKKSVLADAESFLDDTAVLATNTSALSVTEMASVLERPHNFAGLHFFNPVSRMELVEVVRGRETSDETIARLVSFVRALGKTPIVTADTPGFLVNRILFPYLGEAILMVREGHDVRSIDRELRRFGMPMGPLELLDQVGLNVALHVAESLRSLLPDVNDVVEVLSPLVIRKETGRQAGLGFYDYRGKHRLARETDALVDYPVSGPPEVQFKPDGLSNIQRRLIYPMLAESIRCEEEGVVDHAWAIDLGMILGTGFAPHRGGPLRVIDQIGADTVVLNLEQLRSQFGPRFSPPQSLLTGVER